MKSSRDVLVLKNRRNIAELPDMAVLAGELEADEVIASNLAYVAKPGYEALRAYSLQGASPESPSPTSAAAATRRLVSDGGERF